MFPEFIMIVVLIVPPILFAVIAALIRPPCRVIGLALVAGLVVDGGLQTSGALPPRKFFISLSITPLPAPPASHSRPGLARLFTP
jgi:hypothetical protein